MSGEITEEQFARETLERYSGCAIFNSILTFC